MKNTKHTEMNDSSIEQENQENLSQSKRKILTSIGVTSGVVGASALVPSTWVKPAVNSVILPAHAQATDMMMTTPGMDGDMMTTPGMDGDMDGDMMTTSPEPEMMGPTINVQAFPANGEVGDGDGVINYYVSLSDAPARNPETGMAGMVTVTIEVDPLTSVTVSSQPTPLEFNTTDKLYGMEQLVSLTATAIPDDPVVTVTFTASGGGNKDVKTEMFTIVEDDNQSPTNVEAARSNVLTPGTVTVTWEDPMSTTAVALYYIVTAGAVTSDRLGPDTRSVTLEDVVLTEVAISVAITYDNAKTAADAVTFQLAEAA